MQKGTGEKAKALMLNIHKWACLTQIFPSYTLTEVVKPKNRTEVVKPKYP